jgi:hypothetical protein
MIKALTRYWSATSVSDSIVSNGWMVGEYELEMIWNEEVRVAYSPGTGLKGLRKTTTPGWLGQYCDQITGRISENLGFDSRQRKRFFISHHSVKTASGVHSGYHSICTLSSGVNRPSREADRSPPCRDLREEISLLPYASRSREGLN